SMISLSPGAGVGEAAAIGVTAVGDAAARVVDGWAAAVATTSADMARGAVVRKNVASAQAAAIAGRTARNAKTSRPIPSIPLKAIVLYRALVRAGGMVAGRFQMPRGF